MTPEAERFNGWAAMVGIIAAFGARNHRAINPWRLVNDVLLIAASLIGGFIFASLLTEDVSDDDDHFDGGMMQPIQVPASNPT